jgi:hypothetical protein
MRHPGGTASRSPTLVSNEKVPLVSSFFSFLSLL